MKTYEQLTLLTFLLIIYFTGNSFAQPSDADKLRVQISKETNDTNRIKLLIKLGILSYDEYDPKQDRYLKEAFDLSKKKNFRYGLIFGRFYEGLQFMRNTNYDEAINKYKSCIDGLDSLGVVQPTDYPLSAIRRLYSLAGKQTERYQYYLSKVSFYKRHGPKENIANCYHGIALYYSFLGDYDKSIEYLLRAREIYKFFDPFGYATEGAIIGNIYLGWGNFEKSKQYLESALEEFILMNEISTIAYCYNNLGELSARQHDYKRALYYYYSVKKYWSELSSQYIAITMVNISAVHLQLSAIDSAYFYLDRVEKMRQKQKLTLISNHEPLEIDYCFYKYFDVKGNEKLAFQSLQSALNEAQSSKYIPLVLKYTYELQSYLLKKGDSLQALRYLIQYNAIQDSINTMNTKARIASFEIEQQQQQKENEIAQLQSQKTKQRNYYLIGGVLLLLIIAAVLSRLRYKRKRDKEQLTTEFKKQLAEAETKALRAQMNPHFIFNSLNSINSFVMDQKHEIASDYLIKFSKLIRLILDNSRSETISIEKELETLKLYVILEAARFDDKFKCVYNIAEDVDTNLIKIPPMLLQPFVENAFWHGLMQKEGKGTITIDITMSNEQITDNSEQLLRITITDDGIGREKAAELKSKSATHKSHGLKVTSQRIEMMNKLNSTGAKVNIIDLKDEQGVALGTKVELIIPF